MRFLVLLAALSPLPRLAAQEAVDPIAGYFSRADILISEGRDSEALMELEAAGRRLKPKDPRMIRYFERKGAIFLGENDIPPATENFSKAIALAKDLGLRHTAVADAYAGLGACQMSQSRYSFASESFKEGLAQGPSEETRRRLKKQLARSVENQPKEEEPVAEVRCAKIRFYGNRTDEGVLRRHIPFAEGDTIGPGSLADAKRGLNRLHLFKKVDISSSPAPYGGALVDVAVEDGWYIIPFPFVAADRSGARGGTMIEERNFWSVGESMSFSALAGNSGYRTVTAAQWEGLALRYEARIRDFTERVYDDGAYSNTPGLGAPLDLHHTERYGVVDTSYFRHQNNKILSAEVPLFWRLYGEAGLDLGVVSYSSPGPSRPSDTGHQGILYGGLEIGGGDYAEGMGTILGFGLSDLEDRLRPLPEPVVSWGAGVRLNHSSHLTDSDFNFDSLILRGSVGVTWGNHQSLSVLMSGGHGFSLPANQLLGTGNQTALQGTYAREYRGESAGGGSVVYSLPVWESRRGMMRVGAFAEDARAWFGGRKKDKQGVGGGFSFRFWRFPIPLGVGYTYSLDDHEALIGGSIGGRF